MNIFYAYSNTLISSFKYFLYLILMFNNLLNKTITFDILYFINNII